MVAKKRDPRMPPVGSHVIVPWGLADAPGTVIETYGEPGDPYVVARVVIQGSTGVAVDWTTVSVPLALVTRADDYRFVTSPLATTGAYAAAITRIDAPDGLHMHLVTRVAYSVRPPEGKTLDEYAQVLSTQRAQDLVARDGFRTGAELTELLTSHGWERVEA